MKKLIAKILLKVCDFALWVGDNAEEQESETYKDLEKDKKKLEKYLDF